MVGYGLPKEGDFVQFKVISMMGSSPYLAGYHGTKITENAIIGVSATTHLLPKVTVVMLGDSNRLLFFAKNIGLRAMIRDNGISSTVAIYLAPTI